MQVQENFLEDRLPQGLNLLKQLDLEGGGPCTTTRSEYVEGVVVGDGGGEAAIENHLHRLPNHLHEDYDVLFPSPFRYQDHRLPGRLLCDDPVSEC